MNHEQLREVLRIPSAWYRPVVQPGTPHGPAEYDVEMIWGDDQPEGDGWKPLYREALAALEREGAGEPVCKTCNGTGQICRSESWGEVTGVYRGSMSISRCPDCPQTVLMNAAPPAAEREGEKLGEQCIDGGKCHHACTTRCFRRERCGPLSGYTGPWAYSPPAAEREGAVLGWIYEDDLPEGYPYAAMFPYSKVDGVRMFPVYGPTDVQDAARWRNEMDALMVAMQRASEALFAATRDGQKIETAVQYEQLAVALYTLNAAIDKQRAGGRA